VDSVDFKSAGLALGAILVVFLVIQAGLIVVVGQNPPLTKITGVAGTAYREFLQGDEAKQIFKKYGLDVEVTFLGSLDMVKLVKSKKHLDFFMPGSETVGDEIERELAGRVQARFEPFASPLVIVSWTDLLKPLSAEGVEIVRAEASGNYSFDLERYLELARQNLRWSQVDGIGGTGGCSWEFVDLLVRTSDYEKSNSAAMFAWLSAFVRNDRRFPGQVDVEQKGIAKELGSLFKRMGRREGSTGNVWDDFIRFRNICSNQMALIYEFEYIEAKVDKKLAGIMANKVALYPRPNVLATRVVLATSPKGAMIGRLLEGKHPDPNISSEAPEMVNRARLRGLYIGGARPQFSIPDLAPQVPEVIDAPNDTDLNNLKAAVARCERAIGTTLFDTCDAGG
jgi:hypothetical protein